MTPHVAFQRENANDQRRHARRYVHRAGGFAEILNGLQKAWGFAPNLSRVLGREPAALEPYATLCGDSRVDRLYPARNIAYLAIIYERTPRRRSRPICDAEAPLTNTYTTRIIQAGNRIVPAAVYLLASHSYLSSYLKIIGVRKHTDYPCDRRFVSIDNQRRGHAAPKLT